MATLIKWVLSLILALMGIIFLLGMLIILTITIAWAAMRYLFTGNKAELSAIVQQFRESRRNFGKSPFREPTQHQAARESDDQVIDVEARQVPNDTPRRPP